MIQTVWLCAENAFEYLTALQRNAAAVRERPADWMPWNFRTALARIEAGRGTGGAPAQERTSTRKVPLKSTG